MSALPASSRGLRPAGGLAACVLLAGALPAAGCGGTCEPPEAVPEMNAARARAMVPGIEAGLGLSTAIDLGACSADPADPRGSRRCRGETPSCGLYRRSLRVLVAPVGGSLPVDETCPSGLTAEALAARAIVDGRSSERGEWAGPLEPGVYFVAAARPGDRCAVCGAVGAAASCRVEIRQGRIETRAIVL